MEFIDEKLAQYIEDHTSKESTVLQKIDRHTHANVMKPRMLSGHVQGRILSMLSTMLQPKNILEIGTYTGYSAICMAEGLQDNGRLTTLDINEELEDMVRGFFEEAGITEKVDYRIGDALDIIPTLDQEFDLVFIDADKINYLNYYQLVIDKVRKGGIIILDNVLWSGKVIQEVKPKDKDTQLILQLNQFIQEDSRVENVLLGVRDGLMIVRKL